MAPVFATRRDRYRCELENMMLELIEWIRHGDLIHKLSSPYFWLSFAALGMASDYLIAGLTKKNHTSGEK